MYGKAFYVFFDSDDIEVLRSLKFSDSIFFDPRERIMSYFEDSLLKRQKQKLSSIDSFSSEYQDTRKKIEARFDPIVDMFESVETLEQLKKIELPSNIDIDSVLSMLEQCYDEFKFEKFNAAEFNERNRERHTCSLRNVRIQMSTIGLSFSRVA